MHSVAVDINKCKICLCFAMEIFLVSQNFNRVLKSQPHLFYFVVSFELKEMNPIFKALLICYKNNSNLVGDSDPRRTHDK